MRELYHGCLGHAGVLAEGPDATSLGSSFGTAVNSGAGDNAYITPGNSHGWESVSTPTAFSSRKGERKRGSLVLQQVANRSTDNVGSN